MWLSAATCWYIAYRPIGVRKIMVATAPRSSKSPSWSWFWLVSCIFFVASSKNNSASVPNHPKNQPNHLAKNVTTLNCLISIRSAMVKESSGVLVHGDQSILTYIKFLGAEIGWIFGGGETQRCWANYNDQNAEVEVTLHCGLVRESPQNPLNSGLGMFRNYTKNLPRKMLDRMGSPTSCGRS